MAFGGHLQSLTVQCSQPPQAHGQGQKSEAGGGEESRGQRAGAGPGGRRQQEPRCPGGRYRTWGWKMLAGWFSAGWLSFGTGAGDPAGPEGSACLPTNPWQLCAWAGSGSPAGLVDLWGPGTLLLVFIRRPGISPYCDLGSGAVNSPDRRQTFLKQRRTE